MSTTVKHENFVIIVSACSYPAHALSKNNGRFESIDDNFCLSGSFIAGFAMILVELDNNSSIQRILNRLLDVYLQIDSLPSLFFPTS